MGKLVLGFSCKEGFYQDSVPTIGFGWLEILAEDGRNSCRTRFWSDAATINAFASSLRETMAHGSWPAEVRWEDKQEGRAFHLKIDKKLEASELRVHLEVQRPGADPRLGAFCCSFETSQRDLVTFNAAITDLLSRRRSKAALNGC